MRKIFSGGIRATKLYPSPLPDLFKGEQLVLLGRYSGQGDAAVIVSPDRVDEIADGIRRLTDSDMLREELRKKGFAQSAKFSWKRCAKETLAIYREFS